MKQVIRKIRAFFKIKGEAKTMQLDAAEIKNGVVFLHAENDKDYTFFFFNKLYTYAFILQV